ncbi:LysR family transcriptional regulator [Marimonas arenosa]|uniref:LysR family transcriptional regulator n=1 Tax=Marimonas arenosa TaxID=1795305 RepID=A0AAE3WCD0_9RHOB|nr:LysR family transcriptional regulator [Marimonas arenosa]MDQ2089095.1 LysR family transcriptional regulator [Marimonas arenosa]
MLTLNQLRHFHLVAETGNFAQAARLAHITQPALSNSIRLLEEKLALQLFDRRDRPVRLTAAGRELLARSQTLLSESRNLEKSISYMSEGSVGHLRIGMTAVSSASIGGEILARWCGDRPGLSADVTVANTPILLDMLRDETLDLVIGEARDLPKSTTDFETEALPLQSGGAFCRDGHPLLGKAALEFSDLLPYRFAGSHFPTVLLDELAQHFGLKDRREIRIAIDCDNIAVLRDAVANSDLILLTTRACIRNALATGQIRQLPVEIDVNAVWQAITLKTSVPHPAIPDLREVIREATRPRPA